MTKANALFLPSYDLIDAATRAILNSELASEGQYGIRESDAREIATIVLEAAMREMSTANDNTPNEIWF